MLRIRIIKRRHHKRLDGIDIIPTENKDVLGIIKISIHNLCIVRDEFLFEETGLRQRL